MFMGLQLIHVTMQHNYADMQQDKLHVNIVMLHIDIGKFSDVCLHYYDAG